MQWSFGFNFGQTPQFIPNFPTYSNPYFTNQQCNSGIYHGISNPYVNFQPNYNLFSQNCTQTSIPNYVTGNNMCLPPNLVFNNLNENCQQNRSKSSQSQLKQHHQNSVSCQDQEIKMIRFRRRRSVKKQKNLISHNSSLRNDTKNIPKNYGKAMLAYIQKNSRQAKELTSRFDVDFLEFMMAIKSFKSKINTIHDLREMWGQNQKQSELKKCIRILSFHFMRKKCLPYIFNSRVKNYHTHIKYRKKIMQGIQNPQKFTKIKEF